MPFKMLIKECHKQLSGIANGLLPDVPVIVLSVT